MYFVSDERWQQIFPFLQYAGGLLISTLFYCAPDVDQFVMNISYSATSPGMTPYIRT